MSSINRKPVRKDASDTGGRLVEGIAWSLILLVPVNLFTFLLVFVFLHYGDRSYFLLSAYVIGASVSLAIIGSAILAERRARRRYKASLGSVVHRESTLCSVCGAIIPYGDTSCTVCGSRLLKACSACGALSALSTRNCPRCGTAL